MGRRQTPGELAAARIGDWPVQVSARRRLAAAHAASVWAEARTGMVNRAQGLWAHVGGRTAAFEGQVDLAFLATVGAHIGRCPVCEKRWVDGEIPYELLTAAVKRRPFGRLLVMVAREIRAQRRSSR